MTCKRQIGATLVEAAVTSMVFFMFLFAILEFGRAYNIYQVATNAAREGARFAVAPCSVIAGACPYGTGVLPTIADIKTQVNNYLLTAAITTGNNAGNIMVCRQTVDANGNPNAPEGDCGSMGLTGANPVCPQINSKYDCSTVVQVKNPFQFFFGLFAPFGPINITAHSRMRNETD